MRLQYKSQSYNIVCRQNLGHMDCYRAINYEAWLNRKKHLSIFSANNRIILINEATELTSHDDVMIII